MANRRKYNQHSHKGLAIFCVLLALVIAAGAVLGGLQLWGKGKQKPSEWFKKDEVVAEKVEYETVLPANGGMTLPEEVENGQTDEQAGIQSNNIALMSVAIPRARFAAYGISPASETAKTVTATVSPDNEASNTKIKWELAWKDPDSEWATGKEVTDYITLQTNADDLMESKVCTVSCSQAFGEKIELKAIAVDDEEKFATCNIDYVQQVKSVKVAIGDVSVNLAGQTDVTIAIRREDGGMGGAVTITPTLGDVYTVKSDFTAAASLTHETDGMRIEGTEKWLAYYHTDGGPYGSTILSYTDDEDLIGDSIYFDRRLFTQFKFYAGGTNPSSNPEGGPDPDKYFTSVSQARDLATNFNSGENYGGPFKGKTIWTMKVSLTSGKYEYNYESDIVWAAIDETVKIADVQITHDGAPGAIEFP